MNDFGGYSDVNLEADLEAHSVPSGAKIKTMQVLKKPDFKKNMMALCNHQ
jgi:hypothetical protein